MTNAPNIVTLIFIVVVLYALGVPIPFMDELRAAIAATVPYAPLLILFFLARGLIANASAGIAAVLQGVWTAFLTVFGTTVFLVFILPVMIADTFLLGPTAHWLWRNQLGPSLLVILSGFAYWIHVKQTKWFVETYLLLAIILGVTFVSLCYLVESVSDVYRVSFTAQPGTPVGGIKMYPDPATSVQVRRGDVVKFSAFGQVVKGEKTYSPKGDSEDLVPYLSWMRPRGEMEFLIYPKRGEAPTPVPITITQPGVTKVAGFDIGFFAGGYNVWGEATMTADGWLGVGFYQLDPNIGYLKTVLELNPQQTLLGRLMRVEWYTLTLLWIVAAGILVVAGLQLQSRLGLSKPLMTVVTVLLIGIGIITFLAIETSISEWSLVNAVSGGSVGGKMEYNPQFVGYLILALLFTMGGVWAMKRYWIPALLLWGLAVFAVCAAFNLPSPFGWENPLTGDSVPIVSTTKTVYTPPTPAPAAVARPPVVRREPYDNPTVRPEFALEDMKDYCSANKGRAVFKILAGSSQSTLDRLNWPQWAQGCKYVRIDFYPDPSVGLITTPRLALPKSSEACPKLNLGVRPPVGDGYALAINRAGKRITYNSSNKENLHVEHGDEVSVSSTKTKVNLFVTCHGENL